MSKALSVIIVSYNTKVLTAQAVASVLQTSDAEVIVVDNNSTDGSSAYLRRKFGSKIKVIQNIENSGFAKANNLGVKKAQGQFVILLNSDVIVRDDALGQMLTYLQGHPFVGILAAELANPDKSYQPQGGALPTLANVWAWWMWPFPGTAPGIDPYQNPDKPNAQFTPRGWVGGTALMIRKSLYQDLGGLDERIFMYAEDVDLCFRVRQLGLEVGILKSAVVTHLGSASSSSARAVLGEIKGLKYYFRKHKPAWVSSLLKVILFKGALLRYVYFGILKNSREARELYAGVIKA